jgi:hypothetical protein
MIAKKNLERKEDRRKGNHKKIKKDCIDVFIKKIYVKKKIKVYKGTKEICMKKKRKTE